MIITEFSLTLLSVFYLLPFLRFCLRYNESPTTKDPGALVRCEYAGVETKDMKNKEVLFWPCYCSQKALFTCHEKPLPVPCLEMCVKMEEVQGRKHSNDSASPPLLGWYSLPVCSSLEGKTTAPNLQNCGRETDR